MTWRKCNFHPPSLHLPSSSNRRPRRPNNSRPHFWSAAAASDGVRHCIIGFRRGLREERPRMLRNPAATRPARSRVPQRRRKKAKKTRMVILGAVGTLMGKTLLKRKKSGDANANLDALGVGSLLKFLRTEEQLDCNLALSYIKRAILPIDYSHKPGSSFNFTLSSRGK